MRPEPRHWSSSTSGSSWTSPGSNQVVLDNPIFQEEVKSVIFSFRAVRISSRAGGAYLAALSGFCVRTIVVWIPTILLVLRVGHIESSIDVQPMLARGGEGCFKMRSSLE